MTTSHDRRGVIVAIPTRNRATLLRRAVQSVLAQDHTAITLLISDNASADDTAMACQDLAASDSRVVVHRQPTNVGLTGNYNWLMQRAVSIQGPHDGFFMFLSDDDWLESDYVSTCVRKLCAQRDHSMVAGRTLLESGLRPPQSEDDVNLTSDSAGARLWSFCQEVLPTGVFSGLMPLDMVRRLPPQRNVLGHDWILLANIAVLGKIATVGSTAIHRETDGASTSFAGLGQTLGISRWQTVRPLATIACFMVAECLHRSPVMGRLPPLRRAHLACVIVLALFSRRAVPALERNESQRIARLGLSGLRSIRRTVLKRDPLPPARAAVDEWARADLERVACCPVCGSPDRRLLHESLPDQVYGIADGRWHLQGCLSCAAAFLDPRPAPQALGRAYGDGYYTHGDWRPEPDLNDGLRGIRLAIRNAYVNGRFGYDLQPSSGPARLLAYANPRARASDARSFRHLRRPREGARLLDVGCGSGEFVARAAALGWDASGIDIDEAAIAAGQAAGLAVSAFTLQELTGSNRAKFDAVTMSHVIEHVADPISLLSAACSVLSPTGMLWLVTPNLDSRGHRRFGDRWVHLDPPRHLVLFGPAALDLALAEAGFDILDAPTSASGTIASFAQSWRIERGHSPLEGSPVPLPVKLEGQLVGLWSLLSNSPADELIRLARPRGKS